MHTEQGAGIYKLERRSGVFFTRVDVEPLELVLVPYTMHVEDTDGGERRGPRSASMDVGLKGQATVRFYLEPQEDVGDTSVPFWHIPREEAQDDAGLQPAPQLSVHYVEVQLPCAWKLDSETIGKKGSKPAGVVAKMPILRNQEAIKVGTRLTASDKWTRKRK